jgi:hypothetical protein
MYVMYFSNMLCMHMADRLICCFHIYIYISMILQRKPLQIVVVQAHIKRGSNWLTKTLNPKHSPLRILWTNRSQFSSPGTGGYLCCSLLLSLEEKVAVMEKKKGKMMITVVAMRRRRRRRRRRKEMKVLLRTRGAVAPVGKSSSRYHRGYLWIVWVKK